MIADWNTVGVDEWAYYSVPRLNKTKLRILGLNSAKLYRIKINDSQRLDNNDRLEQMQSDYRVFQREEGPTRSNAAYGWIRAKV